MIELMNYVSNNIIIEKAYIKYYSEISNYLYMKVSNIDDVEDLVQDIFLKLLEYNKVLIEDKIRNIIYVIARNLIIDKYRTQRNFVEIELENNYCPSLSMYYNAEITVIVNNLLELESQAVNKLPKMRRKIYKLVRFEGKTIDEISFLLCLSCRTVENHLRIGRFDVRKYVRQYI